MMTLFLKFVLGIVLFSTGVIGKSGKHKGVINTDQDANINVEEALTAFPEGDDLAKVLRPQPEADKHPQSQEENDSAPEISVEEGISVGKMLPEDNASGDEPSAAQMRRARSAMPQSTVSLSNQKIIVDAHNQYRKLVKPSAKNMAKMYWDNRLASAAQDMANECRSTDKHDTISERQNKSNLGVPVGQNYAIGSNTTGWTNAVKAWYAEKDAFVFGIGTSSSNMQVGHYTQEIRAPSNLVGCGSKICKNLNYALTYYCNYAFPNMNYKYPYDAGNTCEACPDHCVDGLCDCGAKLCAHGGYINYTTCECECHNGFTGETCTKCPLVDQNSACNTSFLPKHCSQYVNVPAECPIMCGVCNASCTNRIACKNGGTLKAVGDGHCDCICKEGWEGPDCGCSTTYAGDPDYCGGEPPYDYPPRYCRFRNVMVDCKDMCNHCGKWATPTK